MEHPVSVYREYAPRPELREYVRALAWWGPARAFDASRRPVRESYVGLDNTLTLMFADAHPSILFELGTVYTREGRWVERSTARKATVTGAVTHATDVHRGDRPAMIAVYLRTRGIAKLLGVPANELADRIVPLGDLWKDSPLSQDEVSLDTAESILVQRLARASPHETGRRVSAFASHVRQQGGRLTVAEMSQLTGLSRQHLTRLFNEHVGVPPKLYARLARFRAALASITRRPAQSWSSLAFGLGYADQSHLIADFREFCGLTPEQLRRGNSFHPFVGNDGEPDGTHQ
jgi:AraC-like DNA-binding protein